MSYVPIRSDENSSNKNQTPPEHSANTRTGRQARAKRHPAGKLSKEEPLSFPIIVHCHLLWDWVWQRPQQFISRLSKRHPVLFVETVGPDPNLITPTIRL